MGECEEESMFGVIVGCGVWFELFISEECNGVEYWWYCVVLLIKSFI